MEILPQWESFSAISVKNYVIIISGNVISSFSFQWVFIHSKSWNSVIPSFLLWGSWCSPLQHALIMPPSKERYFDESDELILEDELQRIALRGKLDVQQYVTGKKFTNSHHYYYWLALDLIILPLFCGLPPSPPHSTSTGPMSFPGWYPYDWSQVPSWASPRWGEGGVLQQSEYLISGGRYASCVHTGLSCLICLWLVLGIMYFVFDASFRCYCGFIRKRTWRWQRQILRWRCLFSTIARTGTET